MGGDMSSAAHPAGVSEPVVVFSDAHFSARSDWQAALCQLRPLWRGAATVIFNGDTMDPCLARDPADRRSVEDYIAQICAEDGVRPVLIGGNTDYQLPGPRHIFLAAGRVLVLHGDVLFERISPWRSCAGYLARARREALDSMPHDHRESLQGRQDAVVKALSKFEKEAAGRIDYDRAYAPLGRFCRVLNPRTILAVAVAWWKMPQLAAKFIERYAAGAHCLVMGHAHRPGIWPIGPKTLINTGGFRSSGRPYVVRICDGHVLVRRTERQSGSYVPGQALDDITLPQSP